MGRRSCARACSAWVCADVAQEVRRGIWTANAIAEIHHAATTIQLRWRAAKRLKHRSAIRIQSLWRRYTHRNDLKLLRRARVTLVALVRRARACAAAHVARQRAPDTHAPQRKRQDRQRVVAAYKATRARKRFLMIMYCGVKVRVARAGARRVRTREFPRPEHRWSCERGARNLLSPSSRRPSASFVRPT